MDGASHNSGFRWARFVAVLFIGGVASTAAVEYLAPERFVREAAAVAEIDHSFPGTKLPTADAVRRRALSNVNLTAVFRRLTGQTEAGANDAGNEEAAATIERWRKQLIVEVRAGATADRCRIRFLATEARRDADAAVLVEAVAAIYAGELGSGPWYSLLDKLRAAEDRSQAAVDQLIKAAGSPPSSVSSYSPIQAPRPLEMDNDGEQADGEIRRLTELRTRLLESLQPAHPEVVALDARLQLLYAAATRGEIRRMSVEEEPSAAPALKAPSTTAPVRNLPASVAVAVEKVIDTRATVRARLNDLTAPGAIESPVVTTFFGGKHLWDLRSFWQVVACVPALVVAGATSRGVRITASPFVATAIADADASQEVELVTAAAPTAVPYREAPRVTKKPAPVRGDVTLDTLEQVVDAIGAPVLAVVVRRREPRPTVTA